MGKKGEERRMETYGFCYRADIFHYPVMLCTCGSIRSQWAVHDEEACYLIGKYVT
jgi:hypothetical protein